MLLVFFVLFYIVDHKSINQICQPSGFEKIEGGVTIPAQLDGKIVVLVQSTHSLG